MHSLLERTNRSDIVGACICALGIALAGVLAAVNPAIGTVVGLFVVFMTIVANKPLVLVYGVLVAAFTSVPSVVPTSISLAGLNVRFYEPLLVIVAVYTAMRYRERKHRVAGMVPLVAVLSGGAVLGLASANPDIRVFSDVRPLVYLVLAYFIAAKVLKAEGWGTSLRVILVILWCSAGVTLLASILGFPVANMQNEAAGSTEDVTRLIGPATYLAVAVLCGVVSLYVAGHAQLSALWMYWLPALPLVILTFSRNILVCLGAALLFAIIASLSTPALVRAVKLTLGVVATASLLYVTALLLTEFSVGVWLRLQMDGYIERVLEGITGDSIAEDGSAQFRFEQEDAYIVPAISESPIWGHGFGFAYKPINTGRVVSAKSENLQYYAHNFYLWILVKAGIIGLVLFLLPIAVGLIEAIRSRSAVAVATGAAAVGFLAASVVAPMPIGNPTSVIVGIVFGACVGSIRSEEKKPNSRVEPGMNVAVSNLAKVN